MVVEAVDRPRVEPVPWSVIERIAALAPKPEPQRKRGGFDLDAFIARHLADSAKGPAPYQSGRKWVLNPCPWDPSHTNDSAVIIEGADGHIAATCLHESCKGKDWHALREQLEPRPLRMVRATAEVPSAPTLDHVWLSDVQREEMQWLWPERIPLGMATLLAGDGGVGKSFLSLYLAAAVSVGGWLPGMPAGTRLEPGTVIMAQGEDPLGVVVGPRFDRFQGDGTKIAALGALRVGDEEHAFVLDAPGIEALGAKMTELAPRLVIVDPIVVFTGGSLDLSAANQVRSVMQPLNQLAATHNCAVLVVAHVNKAVGMIANHRILGSVDFRNAARSVLLMGIHPENKQQTVVAAGKSNHGPLAESLLFSWDETGGFAYVGAVDTQADALLHSDSSAMESPRDEAAEFLRKELGDGPVRAIDVLRDAAAEGVTERTLRRAFRTLGGISERHGDEGRRGSGAWFWSLLPEALVKGTSETCQDPITEGNGLRWPAHELAALTSSESSTPTENGVPKPNVLDGHPPSEASGSLNGGHLNHGTEGEYSGGTNGSIQPSSDEVVL